MAYRFGSLLNSANSGRRKIGLYIWILVISSTDITRASKDVQKDPNQKAPSIHADSAMFLYSAGHDLHLSTSFMAKSVPLGSMTKELSLGANLDLTPSSGFLEEDAPSKRSDTDINSNNMSPETTKITVSETEVFHQSNSRNEDQQNLVQQEERLVLGNIETVTPAAHSGVVFNITGTSSEHDSDTATNKLKSPADTTGEIYFPGDFIPFLLAAAPQDEYSMWPTLLDNISSQADLIFDSSGASPSEAPRATASLLPETTWSERYYPMDNLLTATSQNFSDVSSQDSTNQHRSMFVNISAYEASSPSLAGNGSMVDVGPSRALPLANISTNSATEVLPTKTLHQDLSAIHATEIYHFSQKATGSSVDVPLDPDFSTNFQLTTVSAILPQPFSDVTILPSGDHSHTTPIISTGYLPIALTGWQTSEKETISEWEPASPHPEPPHDADLSPLVRGSGSLVSSPVILYTASSSATGVYFQPQHVDTKEWAVPVTVCLSLALLVAVVVTVLTCRRLKTGDGGPRYFGGEAGREVSSTGNKHRETASVQSKAEVHPRYSQPTHLNELDSPRDDRNLNVGQRDVVKGRKGGTTKSGPAPGAVAGRQAFEMDHMLPADRTNVYLQQNEQPNQEEFYRRNEEMYYDDHTFIHGSPNSRRGFSERIQHSPKSGNPAVLYKEDMAYTFNNTSQTEFETSTSSQMSQQKPNIKTRNVIGNEHYTSVNDSSDSRFSYNVATHSRRELAETQHSSSKDGYVSDEYRSEHCWESWNDQSHAKGEHGSARISVSGDNRSINIEDTNSMEGFYSDIRESPHGRTDHRPVMYKCVSFDESRARAIDDTYNSVSSDKSPTRKVSTMSESAMTYLSVPREGFMPMSSAYETVHDLSEAGHPHSSSHFFIGSDSSHTYKVSRQKNVSLENLEIKKLRKRSIDSVEETTETDNFNNAEAKNIKNNRVSEKAQRQPKDDYIFPIVRKAKIKILEERRNKNLAFSNSSSDENVAVATDRLRTRHNARTSDIQNRELEMTVHEAVGSASTASSAPPSRRISHTSHIPTIVLTKEEDETIAESERQDNLPHPAAVKPPRVRRIARANNPFLIEVDSSAVSEKLRRSSAPSMTRRLTPGAGSGQGMVRSASNDHLTRHHFNHLDSYPHRPWSSEFFDLVINSDGYTKDERFKKMIDDRYDALFNNKHPYPMGISSSDGQNFQQDLSPRIWKLLTSASHTSLPRDGQGDIGYSSSRDIGDREIIPKLGPILDSIQSEQLHLISDRDDGLNPESRPIAQDPALLLEIPRSNITSSDTQAGFQSNRHVTHTTAEHETVKARLVYIRDSRSPRPSLAPGTDGIDNGTDVQERTKLANWSGNTDQDNERSIQTEVSHPSESDNNLLTHTKTYWESFDDDLEVERLALATKPVSDEDFTLDNSNSPRNLTIGGSELSSEETANKTLRSRFKDNLRHPFTEAAGANSTGLSVDDLDSADEPVHYQIDGTFSERNPTLDSQTSISREISSPNQNNPDTFEDNFSMNTVNISQTPQDRALTISDTQAVNDTLHKADQENEQQQILRTGPQIPPRRARRRAPNVPKQTRPPSPFQFTNRTDWQSKSFQTKNYSLDNDTNMQVVPDSKNNDWDDKYHLRQSLLNERNDRSETSSIASMLDRAQPRSFSVGENTGTSRTRPQRATSVETDQPSAHLTYFNKWSQFFNEMEPRFLSSANNTVLQHDISHDSVSLSDAELEEYFESTVSPASVPTQKNEQNRLKALLLDDNDESGAKISSV